MYIEHQVLVANDIMTRKVFTLREDTPVHVAIELLTSHTISGAPVVDSNGKLCGIFSEKDCMKVLIGDTFHELIDGHVRDFMSTNVVAVNPTTDIFSLASVFSSSHFRRVPVLDEGELVGIVSRRDILSGIQKMRRATPASVVRRTKAPEQLGVTSGLYFSARD